jgi:uncharacterized protein (UPF0332 family)
MKANSRKMRDSLWEGISPDKRQVERSLKLANRDIKSAEKLLEEEDCDWAFAIAYNSMLQAGRALMFSEGFRPRGEFKHLSVVEFVRKTSPSFAQRLLDSFDRSRRRRHRVVYDEVDTVSMEEASRAIAVAGEFLEEVEKRLEGFIGPKGK